MDTRSNTSHLQEAFETQHGYWSTELTAVLALDPQYVALYDRLLRVAVDRQALTAAQRELIHIAVAAQVTYLNREATALHIKRAIELGASDTEIMETLQLASALGTHSMLIGVPIAHEVFQELGVAESVSEDDLSPAQLALKERFIADRKYWSPHWDSVLAYTPEYFEAYLDLSSVPWLRNTLEDWFKELIYIAIDVATTHLFTAGIQTHTKKAIEYGATPAQVIDVMTLASTIGSHTVLSGAAILHGARQA